ncbi:hypothetical protein [Pseudoduganella chitinolytica]|uniref:Integral membrane protein n=1 Tax=Pseudoduganella chitinolytica TaxID=34070 RepID=A0ABY8BDH1_9BURK|nr:hypothetical protein [Pseudoduganella chitinolytica]WEF33021.1 hypothetical protein PX653_27130 [Pseudoduganella chitinolytica]
MTTNAIMLAQADTDPGFKVPGAKDDKAATPAVPPTGDGTLSTVPPTGETASGMEVAPVAGAPATDTSTRDIAIGGAVFVVLLIVFFFARNAFSNHLVRRRVAPSSADTAGWLLFFGLAFLSAAVVLGFVNSTKFLNVAITGTLLVFGIAAIAGALFTGRR